MSTSPLVSVILPSFNQQAFIKDAIESVLFQDYQNYELIISDDKSTDRTVEIIEKYEKKFPEKIIFLSNKQNLGITKNVNNAIRKSKGKYIVFMGGDDILLPNKFSNQVKTMENNPNITISYHDVSAFDNATGREIFRFSQRYPHYEGDASVVIRYGTFYSALSCMLVRSSIPIYGCDDNILICSDWVLMCETLINGGGIFKYIPEVYALYRRHENSITYKIKKYLPDEELKAIAIIKNKHPKFIEEIKRREADLYFIKFLRNISRFQLINSFTSLYNSIRLSKGFWSSPRILIREIKWRVMSIYNKIFGVIRIL